VLKQRGLKTYEGERRSSTHFQLPGWMKMGGQFRTQASLLKEKGTWCPSDTKLSGHKTRSERNDEEKNTSPVANRIPVFHPEPSYFTELSRIIERGLREMGCVGCGLYSTDTG
jgi:hypothetical protein